MGKIKHATCYGVSISSILLFPICMEIQQVLVSVTTQHLQLVVGQRLQQQETHPLQLVKAYRPPRPQLQVSLYVVQVSVAWVFVWMWALAANLGDSFLFNSLLCYIALGSIIGGSIGSVAALTVVSIISCVLIYCCCNYCKKKGKQSKVKQFRYVHSDSLIIMTWRPQFIILQNTYINVLCNQDWWIIADNVMVDNIILIGKR